MEEAPQNCGEEGGVHPASVWCNKRLRIILTSPEKHFAKLGKRGLRGG